MQCDFRIITKEPCIVVKYYIYCYCYAISQRYALRIKINANAKNQKKSHHIMSRQILSPIIVVLACGSILTAQWSDDTDVNLQVTKNMDEHTGEIHLPHRLFPFAKRVVIDKG